VIKTNFMYKSKYITSFNCAKQFFNGRNWKTFSSYSSV